MTAVKHYDFNKLLELPEVKAKTSIARRVIGNPAERIATLNEQQRAIFEAVKDLPISGEDDQWATIEGYAGTGKSYLISIIVEYWLFTHKVRVAMTAPTNKAVRVLRDQAMYDNPDLEFSTIHSLMGLREQIDNYGKQKFVRLKVEHNRLPSYNVLIIDESSMLLDELFTYVAEEIVHGKLKVIFVGDPCQIPPVGHSDSIPMDPEQRTEFGIDHYTLTDIVRQAKGNPIIEATMQIRDNLDTDVIFRNHEDGVNSETLEGIYWFGREDMDAVKKLLKTYFVSDNFKNNSDFCKVVCYMNKTVAGFNDFIRTMLFGKVKQKLMKGEKLIANKPIIDTVEEDGRMVNKIIFNNNDEFEVLDYTVKSGNYKGKTLEFYDVKVEHAGLGTVITKQIRIIHENSEELYRNIIDLLKELAKKEKQGSWDAGQKWKDFYEFQEVFADVNYNYAITAHKAQGSTYDNCVVVESDIDHNKKIIERNRIKYTAFSRARYKLFTLY